MTFLPIDSITETIDACQSAKVIAMNKYFVWSMSLLRIDSVPMWLGYNCKISLDHSKTPNSRILTTYKCFYLLPTCKHQFIKSLYSP
jgi:hypothetical protein